MGRKGEIKNRLGEVHINKVGEEFEIISCTHSIEIDIKFNDGTILKNKTISSILSGKIKNPNSPSIFGVAYLGQGKHIGYTNGKKCKKDVYWRSMLKRCYSESFQEKYPTYKCISVCSEWKSFQVFCDWFEDNYNSEYMEGWQLDKDILIKENKVYSPETCCFVPNEINSMFKLRKSQRGDLPIGVFKEGNSYKASILKGKGKTSKMFKTVEEAFQAYKTAKEEYIKEVAENWKHLISDKVYQAMYNYQVEITD